MFFYYCSLRQMILNKLDDYNKKKNSSSNQKYNQRNSQFIDSPTRKSDLQDFNEKFKKGLESLSKKN